MDVVDELTVPAPHLADTGHHGEDGTETAEGITMVFCGGRVNGRGLDYSQAWLLGKNIN